MLQVCVKSSRIHLLNDFLMTVEVFVVVHYKKFWAVGGFNKGFIFGVFHTISIVVQNYVVFIDVYYIFECTIILCIIEHQCIYIISHRELLIMIIIIVMEMVKVPVK